MVRTMFILLFITNFVKASEHLQSVNEMAAMVANKEFSHGYYTTVASWPGIDPENINQFINLYNGLVVIINLYDCKANNTYSTKRFIYDQTVIYVQDSIQFETFLDMVNKIRLEAIRIILVLIEINEDELNLFMKTALEKDATDIITVSVNANNKIVLHTLIPYSDGYCGDFTPVPVPEKALTYFGKKYRNFHKCPILVSAYSAFPYIIVKKENNEIKAKGFDYDAMQLLLKTLNATMTLVSYEENREALENNSLTGGFDDLINKKADITLPGVIVNEERYSVALTSYSFRYVIVVWCAPKRREIYTWAKLILPFISRITPLIVLSFVLFIAVITLIQKFGRYHERKSGIIFQSLTLFLGLEAKFETKYWLNNTTYIMWIWYCLVVRIAYQGDLMNGLHKVILEPPIRTVNDALQNLDEIVGSPIIKELYRNTSLEKYFRALSSNDMSIYLQKVVEGKRILEATDLIIIDNFRYDIQILEESVIKLPSCYFMRPRWPGADEFRRKVVIFTENGFFIKIYTQYLNDWYRRGVRYGDDVVPLSMLTLSSCFYGLLVTHVICLVILCLEIFWYKTILRTMKKQAENINNNVDE